MTYTLFEYVKEEAENLTADQPDAPIVQVTFIFACSDIPGNIHQYLHSQMLS